MDQRDKTEKIDLIRGINFKNEDAPMIFPKAFLFCIKVLLQDINYTIFVIRTFRFVHEAHRSYSLRYELENFF